MKEQPELILDTQNLAEPMLPALITVLEQYGYRPITEGTLLKLSNWKAQDLNTVKKKSTAVKYLLN